MTTASAPAAASDLAALRARAAARLADLGLPHARIEEWRFANPAPITGRAWRLAADERSMPIACDAPAAVRALGSWPRHEALLAAGRFHADSGPRHGATLPAGVRIESRAAAAAGTPDDVLALLGTIAQADTPATAF
ncbi:MAG: hypothetical protein ABIP29_10835, partial [Candidatus Eisenbacteria bacterium]